MKRITAILALALSWGMACSGVPSLHWGGGILIDLAGGVPWVTLESTLALSWQGNGWETGLTAAVTNNEWNELQWDGAAVLAGMELASSVVFDPAGAAFTSAQLEGEITWSGVRIEGVARLETPGVGFGVSLHGGDGNATILRELRLRFNLRCNRDAVIAQTCSPDFSFATIAFEFPFLCMDNISTRIELDKTGFTEAWISLGQGVEILPGISVAGSLSLNVDEKKVLLSPSLVLASPAHIDLYWGLDWEEEENKLSGLKLYGVGLHGELGDVRLRGLWSLAPDEISLVKAPYWAVIGFAWEIDGCCGQRGAGNVGFFFGDDQLFDLGQVEIELEIPLGERLIVQAAIRIKTDGGHSLRLGWELER